MLTMIFGRRISATGKLMITLWNRFSNPTPPKFKWKNLPRISLIIPLELQRKVLGPQAAVNKVCDQSVAVMQNMKEHCMKILHNVLIHALTFNISQLILLMHRDVGLESKCRKLISLLQKYIEWFLVAINYLSVIN